MSTVNKLRGSKEDVWGLLLLYGYVCHYTFPFISGLRIPVMGTNKMKEESSEIDLIYPQHPMYARQLTAPCTFPTE